MVSTVSGRRSISTRHSIVLPLPTSPVTFTMPSPAVIAYSSASSVAPRLAPEKKNSVWGVIRNGASRSPKCSRYIVIGVRLGAGRCLLGSSAARFARIGGAQSSTGAARRFEPSIERAARDAEQFRRLRHAGLRDFERGVEVGLLDLLQSRVEAEGLARGELGAGARDGVGAGGVAGRGLALGLRRAHRVGGVLGGEPDRDVLQLAPVAGKLVSRPARDRGLVQREGQGSHLRRIERAVVVEETQLVVAQRAQRRHRELEYRKAVVEVGAEAPLARLLAQVAVGGGDDARPRHAGLRFAHALVLPVLEHAQQLRLQLAGKLADLVQEERAVARVLEVARLGLLRPGESALRVAEERGLHQRRRDRRAVQREERLARARAQVVQREGHALLAAARFALDQCREGGSGVEVDLASQALQRRAFADQRLHLLGVVVALVERVRLQRAREERAQQLRLARLGHQLDRTQGARAARVRLLVLAGEDQDAHSRSVREELADQLEAFVGEVGHGRQAQVDQGEVGTQPLAQPRDRLGAVAGARHFVVARQREREALRDERVIVDQQQARLLHARIIGEGALAKLLKYAALAPAISPVPEETLVDVESVTFAYGRRPVLKGISMRVPRGKVVAIMGSSGSGKTKLMRKLNDALGSPSIIVTHDVLESLQIVDYLYFISDGVIHGEGTPEEIRRSELPYVRQFVHGETDGPVPFHFPAKPYAADVGLAPGARRA